MGSGVLKVRVAGLNRWRDLKPIAAVRSPMVVERFWGNLSSVKFVLSREEE